MAGDWKPCFLRTVLSEHRGEIRHGEEVFDARAEVSGPEFAVGVSGGDPEAHERAQAGAVEEGDVGEVEDYAAGFGDQGTYFFKEEVGGVEGDFAGCNSLRRRRGCCPGSW